MTQLDTSEVLDFLNKPFFQGGEVSISLFTLVLWVVILTASWIVSRISQRVLRRSFQKRDMNPGTTAASCRLLHYLVMIIGLTVALESSGISLSTMFAAGAIFAIGIGFALQTLMQNFVSGLILLLERSIKPGDVLKVEGNFVKVEKMAIRSTQCRTLDDEEVIIPNSTLVQSTVTNYTLRDSVYRLRATVGVTYSSDMAQVRKVLEQVAGEQDWRFGLKDPVVLMAEFGSSSVDWEISIWIDDPWRARPLRSKLNEAIWNALQQAGIVIAFPQLDVHFDPPVVESIGGRRAG